MAKNNNLTDFLTDIANAIRAKKGTTVKINPQDFSSEIASIETGGTTGDAVFKSDVNFYDYDGTLLHSYTKDSFLALSALPDLPTKNGLTCQGWNYTLANAKEYVTDYGVLDIGATYITDDGKTRLYIKTATKGRMNVPLYFSQTVSQGVTIDWGDGSVTTVSGTGYVNTSHTYSNIGEYVITLNPASGCTLGLGRDSSSYCVMGNTTNNGRVYCNILQAVEIGKNVTSISSYAFYYCHSLSSVVIPSNVTSINKNAFCSCYSLSSVVIPSSVKIISERLFSNCYSLSSVVISSSVTHISNYVFYYCHSLSSVVIPSSVTVIGSYNFQNCYSLSSVVIPIDVSIISDSMFLNCYSLSSVVNPIISKSTFQNCYSLSSVVITSNATIGNKAFYNCYSLSSVVIPSNITSIDSYAFYNCYGMAYYDFRALTSVPTLSTTDAFGSIPSDCKIVVPDSLYSSWTTATNWSTYASQIVKASQFNV